MTLRKFLQNTSMTLKCHSKSVELLETTKLKLIISFYASNLYINSRSTTVLITDEVHYFFMNYVSVYKQINPNLIYCDSFTIAKPNAVARIT